MMHWRTAAALVWMCWCRALAAEGNAGAAAGDALGASPGATTQQCSSPVLVARGCSACNPAADSCSQCRTGFLPTFVKTQCSKEVCCNMKPVVREVRIARARLGESVAINLMKFVADDQLGKVEVVLQKSLDPAWGKGSLVPGADRSSRTLRFTPGRRTGVLLLRFYVRDPFRQAAQGLVRIRIYRNSAPVVSAASGQLPVILAGVTAAYTTRELLQAVQATDTDKDALIIRSIALGSKGQGDALQYHSLTKTWRYTCASGKPCVKGGNTLKLTVTDGLAGVAAELRQPVKPRPAFKLLAPVVLTGTESPSLVASASEGQLTAAGFSNPLEIRVPQSELMAQGELIEDNLLSVEDSQGAVKDGVEFVPDQGQSAVARGYRLPFTLGTTSRSQVLLAISSTKSSGTKAAATSQADAAAAPVPPPNTNDASAATAAAAAAGGVPANSCKACIVDSTGACISNVNSQGACPASCVLDPYSMYCYQEVDPRDQCKTCTIDGVGSCIDSGDGRCKNCETDKTGSRCISIGSGGDDSLLSPPPGFNPPPPSPPPPETPAATVNYAWLVPPVRTTSVGMWVSLGCSTTGTISVEFDLADSEDHDGIDSDGFNGDVDAFDPRDPSSTTTKPGGRRMLLEVGASAWQHGEPARKLNTIDALTSGVSNNECYTGANYAPPKLSTAGEAATSDAAGDSLAGGEVEGKSTTDDESNQEDELPEGSGDEAFADDVLPLGQGGWVDPLDLAGSSGPAAAASDGNSGSGKKRALLVQQLDLAKKRCANYRKIINVQQEVPACAALSSSSRAGVWVGGYLSGSEGFIRQVRIQADVEPGGDNSVYIGRTVMTQA